MSNIRKNSQANLNLALFAITLDRSAGGGGPLHGQLTDALRDLILTRGTMSGLRVPASRTLAEELSVSRMTVTTAYDQLLSEGYLVGQTGRGTFVADHLPHLAPPATHTARASVPPRTWRPFQTGLPDQSLFPYRQWGRHLERAWGRPSAALLAQPDPMGWRPLREAICDHLSAWRALECRPDQVIITSGAVDAFRILTDVAFKPGQTTVIEDPGWSHLRHILTQSGVAQVPIRIDQGGLDAAQLPDDAAAAIVTPSRHYPTGKVMSLPRRLALLDWARCTGAVVIEDDYDSEFRYRGQPLPSLAGIDGLQRTIFLGSFSKLLSGALRIGYVVVPEALLDQVRASLSHTGSQASLVPQPALAEFMSGGDFAIHLRRMRRTYAKRQAALLTALAGAETMLEIEPESSGMHLFCPLRPSTLDWTTDTEIANECAKLGLTVKPLSDYSVLPDPAQGVLLGYSAFDEVTLTRAAQTFKEVLNNLQRA